MITSSVFAGATFKIWNDYVSWATDNTGDLGSSTLEFKNLYIDGLAYIDGFGENTDMGDYDIYSLDGLYGVDNTVYIDMGVDGQIDSAADISMEFDTPQATFTGSLEVLATIDTLNFSVAEDTVIENLYVSTTTETLNLMVNSTTDTMHLIADYYYASDGSIGITQSETGVTDFDIVIENGLITSFTKN